MMVMDVIVTPSEEAEPILSLLASSKLRLGRDVALAGSDKRYWDSKRFYELLGLSVESSFVVDPILNEAIAVSLESNSLLERASSCLPDLDISVERPSDTQAIFISNGPQANSERNECNDCSEREMSEVRPVR